jgi:hypothetical protein
MDSIHIYGYGHERKVDFDKYQGSKLLSKLSLNKDAERTYAHKVVSAFENFKALNNNLNTL